MKKKLSIILLLLTISLCSIASIDRVWGVEIDSDTSSVLNGEASGCGDTGNCYGLGTGGIRMMLVDQNGNRVKKNDGTNTKIVEYWLYKKDDEKTKPALILGTDDSDVAYSVYYKTVYMKQQLYNQVKNADDENNPINYTKVNNLISIESGVPNLVSIETVAPGILDDLTSKFSWYDTAKTRGIYHCSTNEYDDGELIKFDDCSGTNKNTRNANVASTIINKIIKDARDKQTAGNLSNSYLNNILKQMGLTNGISDLGENYFIQIEPLTQWSNSNLSDSCGKTNVTFFGTPTEFILFDKAIRENKVNIDNEVKSNKKNTRLNENFGDSGDIYRCAFNGTNTSHYYDLATIGIYTNSDVMPKDKDGNAILSRTNVNSLKSINFSNYSMTNTESVGFISLKEFGSDCNTEARKYLSANGLNNFNKTDNKLELDAKYKTLENLFKGNKYITNECYNNGTLNESKCYQLSKEYLENVGVTPYTNVDLCSPSNCVTTVEAQVNLQFDSYKSKGYKRIIEYLRTKFPEEEGLNPTLWNEFFQKKATCEANVPICSQVSVVAKCSNGGNFIFSDSTDIENCIKKGWAYNNKTSRVQFATGQSSVDYDFGIDDYPGYCQESVEFNFPGKIDRAVAGTVFKWGIDNSKNSNKFGTMIVKRVCYVSEGIKSGSKKNINITSEWLNRVSPNIGIVYNQALFDDSLNIPNKNVTGSLDAKFKSLDVNVRDFNNNEINGNFNIRDITENSTNKKVSLWCYRGFETFRKDINSSYTNCNKINNIEMTATYDILYTNDFSWYADKTDNGELVSDGKILKDEGEIPASYAFAGYGIPFSYINSSNEHCINSYGYKGNGLYTDADEYGELKVQVTNIGTRNINDSDSYHFDSLMTFALKDDDDSNNTNSVLDYSCPFNVTNPLFDTEMIYGNGEFCEPWEPKGIDVVFRTVDLISSADQVGDAFPGRSGLGKRAKGANWAKYDESTIADILSDKVYQEEPMYEITLDSPLIQQIRVWNNEARAAGIDPYTDMSEVDNGEDINAGNTGYFYSNLDKTVRSRFLTKLYDQYNGKGKFKSICIKSGSEEGLYNRVKNCNQSWWKEETDDKNTITINITEKSIEE